MEAFDRCFFNGSVHPLYLPVRPRMVDLSEAMVNAMVLTCPRKDMLKGKFVFFPVGDFTNLIDKGWATGNISGWDIDGNYELPTPAINADYYGYTISATGRVAANQIAADAIAAQHIRANAIITDKIAANAITADKIVAGAITADKIAAGAITTDTLAAGSIHGSVIQAGTLDAGAIAAGTITADKIMANTVTANNLEPSAIAQVAFGSGTNFSLGLNIQHGHVLIIAQTSGLGNNWGGSGWIQRNGVNLVSYSAIKIEYVRDIQININDHGPNYNVYKQSTFINSLLYSDTPPPGWQAYTFPSGSAIIMNYKR